MSAIEKIINKPIKEMTAIEYLIYEKYVQWNQKTGQNSKSGYDAIQAADELTEMQVRIEKLEAGIKLAQSKLRSTQINWQEDCLFDCDDILTNTLKGE